MLGMNWADFLENSLYIFIFVYYKYGETHIVAFWMNLVGFGGFEAELGAGNRDPVNESWAAKVARWGGLPTRKTDKSLAPTLSLCYTILRDGINPNEEHNNDT